LLRVSATAKEWNCRPSEFFPELDTYQAFVLDEICAHAMIELRDQARKDADEEIKKLKEGAGKKIQPGQKLSLEDMMSLQNKIKK
jgi:adenylate kinase